MMAMKVRTVMNPPQGGFDECHTQESEDETFSCIADCVSSESLNRQLFIFDIHLSTQKCEM
jgi:hypothetical protein